MTPLVDVAAQAPVRTRLKLLWAMPLAIFLAVAAFANAAARNDAAIPAFSSLGPSFYGWRAAHARAERSFVERASPETRSNLQAISRPVAVREPLALPAWRSVALAAGQPGRHDRTRTIMRAADRLSRRDPIVQAWLIDDGIRRSDISGTLRHFDALLRTEPEARVPLLTRLVGVLGNARARRDLARFVASDTPWYPEFAAVALQRTPRIAPLAQLLMDADAVPDDSLLRQIYAGIVTRMVREGEFDLLRRLYPSLPGAGEDALSTLSLTNADESSYPPIGWEMLNEPDRAAAIVDSDDGNGAGAIEGVTEPLIDGLVARRLVFPPADATAITWRVIDRDGWRDSTAVLQARCLDAVAISGNLFAIDTAASLALPRSCPVAMVELRMFGGTGRDPATIVIDRIAFARSGSAR